jgi:hypothetical protein
MFVNSSVSEATPPLLVALNDISRLNSSGSFGDVHRDRRASKRAVSFRQPASELGRHRLRSISLTHGADDLDARGRSPMCRQSSRPSLGGEAGGRSLGFISLTCARK